VGSVPLDEVDSVNLTDSPVTDAGVADLQCALPMLLIDR
jgi:hypothetical protein